MSGSQDRYELDYIEEELKELKNVFEIINKQTVAIEKLVVEIPENQIEIEFENGNYLLYLIILRRLRLKHKKLKILHVLNELEPIIIFVP